MAQDGNSVAETSDSVNVTFQRGQADMNDRIVATTGNDTYDGGLGSDTVDYSAVTTAVSVDLSSGRASGAGTQSLTSIENIVGTSQGDVITGNASDNVIDAGSGNDRVNGGGGNDTFIGGLGDDRYDGGTGTDVLDYSSATRAIAVDDGDVTGMGSDRYSNVEKIIGSKFADTFQGGKNVDTFDGGAGNDWFRGYEGSDIFTGGAGSDTFVWEEKDVVSGKKSQGVDTITDFSAGDRLDVSDITDGFNPVTLVKVTDTAAGSMVSVKVGSAFYDVVLLQSVHGITATSLLADGQLIA
jgi:Ca2+-binding RTX toxin-like protein